MTFPAMHPSEAVAPHSARGQKSSLLNQAVAASVHGGFPLMSPAPIQATVVEDDALTSGAHIHSSSSQDSTSAALSSHRAHIAASAAEAHSWSSVFGVVMVTIFCLASTGNSRGNPMTSSYGLPLVGGVVQAQRLVVPPTAIKALKSYRHACRLAWKLRCRQGMTKRTLAEEAELYATHVTDYFSVNEKKRELPARCIAKVERVLGNTVISQYQAWQANLTVLEELQAMRTAA